MIIGGTAAVGSLKKARKTYLRMVQSVQLKGTVPKIARREGPIIGFSEEDVRRLHHPHDDALVVSMQVGLQHALGVGRQWQLNRYTILSGVPANED